MKRLILLLSLFTLSLIAYSQSVSYVYKALAAEGCSVTYHAVVQDSVPKLMINVKSDRMMFQNEPTLLLKTTDGEVLKSVGEPLNSSNSSGGGIVTSTGYVIPIEDMSTSALFPLTWEDVDKMNKGIVKVRITLLPMNHEREFRKDVIGSKLYKAFIKTKNQLDESF